MELSYTQCDYTTLKVWLNGEDITGRTVISQASAIVPQIPLIIGQNTLSASIQTTQGGMTLEAHTTFYCILEPQRYVGLPSPMTLAFDEQGYLYVLDFHLNGQPIGSELPAASERGLEVEVHATAPIRSLDIIKNNGTLFSSTDPVLDVVDLSLADGPSNPVDFYYVRVVQEDGQLAWSSPIWVGQ